MPRAIFTILLFSLFLHGQKSVEKFLLSDFDFTNQNVSKSKIQRYINKHKGSMIKEVELDMILSYCKKYTVNPVVVLTQIEKEASLVRNQTSFDPNLRYRRALGYACWIKRASVRPGIKNKGNGVVKNINVNIKSLDGTYGVFFISPTRYEVWNPENKKIGSGECGEKFISPEISFTISSGEIPFKNDDRFIITVFRPFEGFENQIKYGVKNMKKRFLEYKKGCSVVISGSISEKVNPNLTTEELLKKTTIYPENGATYALYMYTPFYGETIAFGHKTVGNRRFMSIWKIFNEEMK